MTKSLRGRLLIGVISLVIVGLLISDIATYAALQTFLVKRIDDQLASVANSPSGRQLLVNVLTEQQGRGPSSSIQFPPGTVTEEISPSGTVLVGKAFFLGPAPTSIPLPVLPSTLPNAGTDKGAPQFTVAGTNGVSQFRVIDWP